MCEAGHDEEDTKVRSCHSRLFIGNCQECGRLYTLCLDWIMMLLTLNSYN